jgi:hypothetical protein
MTDHDDGLSWQLLREKAAAKHATGTELRLLELHHRLARLEGSQAANGELSDRLRSCPTHGQQPAAPPSAQEMDALVEDALADEMVFMQLPEGAGARLITRALELWGRQPANAWGCPECLRELREGRDGALPTEAQIRTWLDEDADVDDPVFLADPDKPRDDFLAYPAKQVPAIIIAALRRWGHAADEPRFTDDDRRAVAAVPVAWCNSDEFNNAATKRQSFCGWREEHRDCDMALYAAPWLLLTPPPAPARDELNSPGPAPAPPSAQEMDALKSGLHGKYIITKAINNQPVDYPCFVLRVDGSDLAAIAAFRAYALATRDQKLKTDILDAISLIQPASDSPGFCLEPPSPDEIETSFRDELNSPSRPAPALPSAQEMDALADEMLFVRLPEGAGARLITRALELWGQAGAPHILQAPDFTSLLAIARNREPWATWLGVGGFLESAHFELFDLMMAVLARFGRPVCAPIPISERLPGA